MSGIFRKLLKFNIRSVFLNFYLLPLAQAIRFPLFFARNVKVLAIHRGGVMLNSKTVRPAMVQIGYEVTGNIDGKYERAIVEIGKSGKVIFDGKCCLGSGTRLNVYGTLRFGDGVRISGNTNVCCFSDVEIGSNTLVSWDCLFMDTDFHKVYINEKIMNENSPIKIGRNCWIGCRTTVLKGSEIPCGSVVGAGSLVCKKFDKENAMYGGNPARLLKENVRWED